VLLPVKQSVAFMQQLQSSAEMQQHIKGVLFDDTGGWHLHQLCCAEGGNDAKGCVAHKSKDMGQAPHLHRSYALLQILRPNSYICASFKHRSPAAMTKEQCTVLVLILS
jgi:hypothetical protein